MSRSRASRRCWKPSSRTSTSLSNSSTAAAARAARSGPCRCGTSGRFSSSTIASSLRPPPAAVAAAEDRHAQAAPAVEAGDVLHARRLAGAADGQVADADDGHRRLVPLFPAPLVHPVAKPHRQPVRQARQPEPAAQQRRPGAAPLSAHQGLEARLVHDRRKSRGCESGPRSRGSTSSGGVL